MVKYDYGYLIAILGIIFIIWFIKYSLRTFKDEIEITDNDLFGKENKKDINNGKQ